MKVRAGSQAAGAVCAGGAANRADRLPLDNVFIFFNVNFRNMAVNRGQAVAVDNHNVAITPGGVFRPGNVAGSGRF